MWRSGNMVLICAWVLSLEYITVFGYYIDGDIERQGDNAIGRENDDKTVRMLAKLLVAETKERLDDDIEQAKLDLQNAKRLKLEEKLNKDLRQLNSLLEEDIGVAKGQDERATCPLCGWYWKKRKTMNDNQ